MKYCSICNKQIKNFYSSKCKSCAMKEIARNPEYIKKLSNAHSGSKNSMFGKKHSLETINKIKETLKHRTWVHPHKGKYTARSTLKKLIRISPKSILWRKTIFARDHYKCQICGQIGGKLKCRP